MNKDPLHQITPAQIAAYKAHGAVMLPGLFDADWIDRLRSATERSIRAPSAKTDSGFTRNRNMWKTDPDFRAFVFESPASAIAKVLLGKPSVRLYFDHLFVKEPGTELPTPWHQDMPYWPVRGGDVVSIWLALDDVSKESSGLVYVKGSHLAAKFYKPVAFVNGKPGAAPRGENDMPDIDSNPEKYDLLGWNMKAGDCIVHHGYVIHGAAGNSTRDRRRRALSTRWADLDTVFDPRPEADKHLMDVGLAPGAPLEGPDFPLL